MDDQWFFVVKLLALSAVLAAAIKYLAPFLNLPATTAFALVLVLTPSVLLAVLLVWRQSQFDKRQDKL